MQRVKIKIAKNRRQWEKGECLLGELHNARLMSFKTAITQHARWLDQRNQNGSTGDPGHLETPFQGPGTGEPNTTQLATRTALDSVWLRFNVTAWPQLFSWHFDSDSPHAIPMQIRAVTGDPSGAINRRDWPSLVLIF